MEQHRFEILERLLQPHLTLDEFLSVFYGRKPYASPNQAQPFCNLISWPVLEDLFHLQNKDSWPVRQGQISKEFTNSTGTLNPLLARCAFASGHSIVIRHAEKSHMPLHRIAEQFQTFFARPVDLQVYVTPAGEQGFDWHYDVEEVFVIQTHGAKEFRLLKNTTTSKPLPMLSKENSRFSDEPKTPELRCLLHAGDWLYIPAGYWHKAQAIRDSFHISVGVMPG